MKELVTLNSFTNDKGQIKSSLLKQALLNNNTLKVWNDSLVLKTSSHFWRIFANSKELQRHLRSNVFDEQANNALSADILKSTIDDILVDPRFLTSIDPAESTILFKNGIVSLESCELQRLEKEGFHMSCINANFETSIIPQENDSILKTIANTRFSQLLDEMFPCDSSSQKRLLEVLGYLLSPTTGLKKAVLFIGKPNTGKSLLVKLLRALLPPIVLSNLDISRIGRHNENGSLLGAHLNISEDFDSTAKVDMSTLKLLIGNEVVSISQKYQPSVSIALRTKLLMVGNALPSIKPKEIAPFIERMLFLRFDKEPETKDQNLIKELESELDIISTACVYAYSKTIRNGFTVSQHSADWLARQVDEQQSEKLFISDMLVYGPSSSFIPMRDLQSAYRIFCTENGLTENRTADLRQGIYDAFDHVRQIRKNMSSQGLGNIRCLAGLTWNFDELKQLDINLYKTAMKIKQYFYEEVVQSNAESKS